MHHNRHFNQPALIHPCTMCDEVEYFLHHYYFTVGCRRSTMHSDLVDKQSFMLGHLYVLD